MDALSAIQDKIGEMVLNGTLEALPVPVRRRVRALKDLQAEHSELESKFLEEKKALEKKYELLYQPVYEKRTAIVSGAVEPEVKEEEAAPAATAETKEGDDVKGVPEFWLRAMRNHYLLNDMIQDHDEEALRALVDIKSGFLEGEQKGFYLEFHFAENAFFENRVLTKKYFMVEEDEPVLDHAEGTPIQWKQGKNVTVTMVKKKQKSRSGNKRTVTKEEPQASFFNFFSPPEVPSQESLETMEEEEEEELQTVIETDYEMGSVIRSKLIPNAVEWYTGEAEEDEGMDFDEDEDDEHEHGEDCDHDHDDDDEDEEEEEPAPKPTKGKKGKGGAAASAGAAFAPGGEKDPECKQQ
eukprot:GILK01000001.1.p1 GENE.GILK01000001.1~~GILK01000001.1.p1  ORF type:complete len:362 (-),score=115.28 GILK01000001.1:63-1121(-)